MTLQKRISCVIIFILHDQKGEQSMIFQVGVIGLKAPERQLY